MKREKIIYEGKEIEVISFETVVHLDKGTKHALGDIDAVLKEEAEYKRTKSLTP